MGGSSKSSTTSTPVTSQATQTAEGFISAPVFNLSSTGGSISLSTVDQFSDGVKEMTLALIDLVNDAGGLASKAIDQVSIRTQEATQPDLTIVKYIPILIGGVVVLGGLALFFGKK